MFESKDMSKGLLATISILTAIVLVNGFLVNIAQSYSNEDARTLGEAKRIKLSIAGNDLKLINSNITWLTLNKKRITIRTFPRNVLAL